MSLTEVKSFVNCSRVLRSTVDDLNLAADPAQMLLVPACNQAIFPEHMRILAVTSYDCENKKWVSTKAPSLPRSAHSFHVCLADFSNDDLWLQENATFSKSEISEVTSALVAQLKEMKANKSETDHTSDRSDAADVEIHDETLEGTEIDPCEASSSSRSLGTSYFHVGDGFFSTTPFVRFL